MDALAARVEDLQRGAEAAMQSLVVINSLSYSVARGEETDQTKLKQLLDAFREECDVLNGRAEAIEEARSELEETLARVCRA